MLKNNSISFSLAGFLFILSGIAALIYQVTWFKYLSYFLGNGTYAQSIVLGTFMGGLAIGAWYFGKKSDQSKNPFKLFAWLEILIGLYCVFYEPIFDLIKSGFITIVSENNWAADSSKTLWLSFLASTIALIIPTFLMGGTLPVLVKCISSKVNDVGKNVALLYFINSLGAVIGSMLAGFYLLSEFGLRITNYFGATLDIAVGIFFLFFFKNKGPQQLDNQENTIIKKSTEQKKTNLKEDYKNTVLLIAFLSGLSSMIYEVVWLRLLIPILSSTTHSFTIILTVFITGIAFGSLLIYLLFKWIRKPMITLGYFQLAIVCSVFISINFYHKVPYYIWKIVGITDLSDEAYLGYLSIQFLYVFALLIVPTIFMGMSLPLISKLYISTIRNTGKEVGVVFGLNTIGTVIGSLLAGLLLIPLIGLRHTLELAIAINIISTILVFRQVPELKKGQKTAVTISLLFFCFFYGYNINTEQWARGIMLSQIPRKINRESAPKNYKHFIESTKKDNSKIVYYKEGIGGTIVVCKTDKVTALYTNGKSDANSVSDLQTQSSLGHTPILLHPSPDSVFVIGFGAGHTIGSVLMHENVKYAEVAEISENVIEASNFFKHVNHHPLENKKLKVIESDGIAALRVSPYKYDVIISQPSNPWSAGVGNLFTQEFFRDCKKKLKPGGYVAQWFGLYEMNEDNLKLILRTALHEFKHIEIWTLGTNDILLLCSENKFNFNLNKIENKFNKVKDLLSKKDIGITSFPVFISQQFLSNTKALRTYVGDGPLNTENLPLLEHLGPKSYFKDESANIFPEISDWYNYQNSSLLIKEYSKNKALSQKDIIDISHFKSDFGTLGNDKFNHFFKLLSPNFNSISETKKSGLPTNLFVGKINNQNKITPLKRINPQERISSWMCCGVIKENEILTYTWEKPNGEKIIEKITYQSNWNYSWTALKTNYPLEEGSWNLSVEGRGELLANEVFTVDPESPLSKNEFPHTKIFIGIKNEKGIKEMSEVHPMQKILVSTIGPPYGYKETVNIVWTTPSGKKISQLFNYLDYYEQSWNYIDASFPLEEGKWSVEIQNFHGEEYIKTRFIVTNNAKFLPKEAN